MAAEQKNTPQPQIITDAAGGTVEVHGPGDIRTGRQGTRVEDLPPAPKRKRRVPRWHKS